MIKSIKMKTKRNKGPKDIVMMMTAVIINMMIATLIMMLTMTTTTMTTMMMMMINDMLTLKVIAKSATKRSAKARLT